MNYELAKQLKDAGFPFEEFTSPLTDKIARLISSTGFSNTNFIVFKDEPTVYKTPTLSELIEACGKEFDFLAVSSDRTMWRAAVKQTNVEGSTPEEAVAHLWLALQGSNKE